MLIAAFDKAKFYMNVDNNSSIHANHVMNKNNIFEML